MVLELLPVIATLVGLGFPNASAGQGVEEPVYRGRTVQQWVSTLSSKDQVERWNAMQVLSRVGPAAIDAIPALAKAVNDSATDKNLVWMVGRPAAELLGRFGPQAKAAVAELQQAMKSPNPDTRCAAAEALFRIDLDQQSAAMTVILDASGSLDEDTRLCGYIHLTNLGPLAKSAVPTLRTRLRNPDEKLRNDTVDLLGYIGPPAAEAVPDLIGLIQNIPGVDYATAEALGRIGPSARAAVPAIRAMADRPQKAIDRQRLKYALAQIEQSGRDEVIAELLTALKDKDLKEGDRTFIVCRIDEIGRFSPDVIRGLASQLSDHDTSHEAAKVLYKAGAYSELIAALKGRNPEALSSISLLVHNMGPAAKSSIPALIALLKDDNTEVWAIAAEALGRIGPASVPSLLAALTDKDWHVGAGAALALGFVDPAPREAIPPLLAAAKDSKSAIQFSAIEALGKMGVAARSAAPALLPLLKDQHPARAFFAAEALPRIDPTTAAEATPVLVRSLQGQDVGMRRRAVTAIRSNGISGAEVLQGLRDALQREDDVFVRSLIQDALRYFTPKSPRDG